MIPNFMHLENFEKTAHKIYRPINDTWEITNENLEELKNRETRISKFGVPFKNVYYSFRLRTSGSYNLISINLKDLDFKLDFVILALKATANITINFKHANFKNSFKDITKESEYIKLPSNTFLDEINNFIGAEKLKIEIKGMFVIERNEYPNIPRTLNDGLWKNGVEQDFEIIVASENEKEIKVKIHKELLLSQSPVFEGMFKSGMKESNTNTLKITDFNYETVNAAVQFFYGQEFSEYFSFKVLFELLRFSDKYLIDHLTNYIISFILYRISSSNVCEIYNFAVASNFIESVSKLQKECYDFLVVCLNENIPLENFEILDKEFVSF
uniref:BTB domain-containing protein n=1 Tax=Panagrolaimus davidi TaxID=227884 RepID=A0A914Q7I6_9BILA